MLAAPRVSGSVLRKPRKSGDQFYAKYRVNGRQFKKRIGPVWTQRGRPAAGYYTARMAQAALHAILTDARRGAIPEPIHRGHTFGQACDDWLHYVEFDKARAPTTVADYTRTVKNHFLPEFGADTPLAIITRVDVEAFRDRLLSERRMTRSSIQKILILLHGMFKRAKRRGWIALNPSEDIERVTARRTGDFNVLSVEEVHAVVRAAADEQDACIYALAAFAGLRMGELRALRWRDVDFAGHTIHVRANYTHCREGLPKSGKVRAVPLVDHVAAALDGLSRREHFTHPGDLVFCNLLGSYLHDGQLRRRFYAALDAAALGAKRDDDKPITFHDLRHTFGTLAVKVWDLPKVQGYMGHADISTTMGYVHHVPKITDAASLSRLVEGREDTASLEPADPPSPRDESAPTTRSRT